VKTGTAPSTTAVTFAVASGGTDVIFWQCMGHQ
jgi:predicted cobalt transporter CbtA